MALAPENLLLDFNLTGNQNKCIGIVALATVESEVRHYKLNLVVRLQLQVAGKID